MLIYGIYSGSNGAAGHSRTGRVQDDVGQSANGNSDCAPEGAHFVSYRRWFSWRCDRRLRSLSNLFVFFCTCSQVSLGSLLIFSHRSSGAGGSRCLSEDQLRHRVDKFRKSYWDRLNVSRNLPQWNTMTCAQIARELRGELSNRSVSPWRYRYVTRTPLRGPRGDKYALRYHERAEIATVRHNRGGGSTHNLY